MDALISAAAARVAFIEGVGATHFHLDMPGDRRKVPFTDLRTIFVGCTDVIAQRNTSEANALKFAQLLRRQDQAIQLLDLLLDKESDDESRTDAAEFFAELLTDREIFDSVEKVVYAFMPDIDAWTRMASWCAAYKPIVDLAQRILALKNEIARVRNAFDAIPLQAFGLHSDRSAFQQAAIKTGVFRDLVVAEDAQKRSSAMSNAYLYLRHEKNFRAVIPEWTKSLGVPAKQRSRMEEQFDPDSTDRVDWERITENDHFGGYERFQATLREKAGITRQLRLGDVNKARRYAHQLISRQLKEGGGEFAVKSLCSLAQEAKNVGQYDLQIDWLRQAVSIGPNDGWAHGQVADAYLSLWRLGDAEKSFIRAGELGQKPFAETGRARILRYSNRLQEALDRLEQIVREFPEYDRAWATRAEIYRDMHRYEDALVAYNAAIERFPDASVFLCGKAATLAQLGRMREARELYAAAIDRFPNEYVPRSGLANVLKEMGQLPEALSAFRSAARDFPNEVYLSVGEADVLRVMGHYDDALRVLRSVKRKFHWEPVAYNIYAETLRESDRIPEAIEAYKHAVKQFPSDVRTRNGYASALRAAGDFEGALREFSRNVRDFPYDLFSLGGRANLLKLLGRHEEALKAYLDIDERRPDYSHVAPGIASVLALLGRFDEAERKLSDKAPVTISDWAALRVRGMIRLRRGDVHGARQLLQAGMHSPFYKERRYSENALAVCAFREGQFGFAKILLAKMDSPVSRVLSIRALIEIGEFRQARAAYKHVNDNIAPRLAELRDYFGAQLGIARHQPGRDRGWMETREAEILLEAA